VAYSATTATTSAPQKMPSPTVIAAPCPASTSRLTLAFVNRHRLPSG